MNEQPDDSLNGFRGILNALAIMAAVAMFLWVCFLLCGCASPTPVQNTDAWPFWGWNTNEVLR
jgi:hypothetical protein